MKDHPFMQELAKVSKKIDKCNKLLMERPEALTTKKILNNKECMDVLNISSGTLANWRKQGKIPFKQIDNKIYYLTDEIIRMMKS